MAEIRNTFVKSKMNKDLDDRLLSKGEYRNAQNAQVSRSEGEDVGALENILGNKFLTNWSLSAEYNIEVIGYAKDDANDRAFFIATNYTDTSNDRLSNPAPYGALCYVLLFDNKGLTDADKYKILVQGRFLNFSKTHHVYGIDLIEDLLFWTDDRNQPRKINVTKAIADNTYYTTEDQISVSKYFPYKAPLLFDEVTLTATFQSDNISLQYSNWGVAGSEYTNLNKLYAGMQVSGSPLAFVRTVTKTGASRGFTLSQVSAGPLFPSTGQLTFVGPSSKMVTEEFLPPSIFGVTIASPKGTTTATLDLLSVSKNKIFENMQATFITGEKRIIDTVTQNATAEEVTITWTGILNSNLWTALEPTDPDESTVRISWPNPNYVSTWPGDEDFLKDKFYRFAYRFQFDDGEYSLISPFTQPAFIPINNGYIPSNIPNGQGQSGGTTNPDLKINPDSLSPLSVSTIMAKFENSVQQVNIRLQLPDEERYINSNYKITQIQVLSKESDGLAINVVEEINLADFSTTSTDKFYDYSYQSRKPFRVLPERETLRVFDKVPIRAKSQSVVGNRVVYGNFIDKHSPPANLDYFINVSEKLESASLADTFIPTRSGNLFVGVPTGYTTNSYSSYPTHTVKQNRTYQVGIVLSDRYGRQSDVILSSITSFAESNDSGETLFDGSTFYNPFGLKQPSTVNQANEVLPGTWRGESLKVLFSSIIPATSSNEGYPGLYKSGEYTSVVDTNSTQKIISLSSLDPNVAVGDIVTGTDSGGAFVDSVTAVNTSNDTITVNNNHTLSISDVITISGPENKLGWYTYKFVVKQQQQEYYNAFLGNICKLDTSAEIRNGTLAGTFSTVYMTSLISDNVNKIPADLGVVSPEQNQFGTSDTQLNLRVGSNGGRSDSSGNAVYDPQQSKSGNSLISINGYGKVLDLGLAPSQTIPTTDGLFQSSSNPPCILIQDGSDAEIGNPLNSIAETFSVVEIVPPTSRLEIYWESSTSGLVSELNQWIEDGATSGPIAPNPPPVVE